MKRLVVNTLPGVAEAINDQMRFIALDSIDRALEWEDRLLATVSRLGELHGHAVDAEASRRFGKILRKLVFEGTYLIYYRVDDAGGFVEVVSFRHGARLPRRGEP